jgi:Uma2 family endonuclease
MRFAQSQPAYTIDDYVALERQSEERHEYLDGQIYAMAGESLEHSIICFNLAATLGTQLRGKNCLGLSPNMRVRSGPYDKEKSAKGMFSYADAMVVCGEPLFHDEQRDVLLNPTVIIEVLSPTTEAFDRGEKFLRYRTHIETLIDYVLVSQSRPLIEHFLRQPKEQWLYSSVNAIEDTLYLASIDCHLRLSEVYDRIAFPPEQPLVYPE